MITTESDEYDATTHYSNSMILLNLYEKKSNYFIYIYHEINKKQ